MGILEVGLYIVQYEISFSIITFAFTLLVPLPVGRGGHINPSVRISSGVYIFASSVCRSLP